MRQLIPRLVAHDDGAGGLRDVTLASSTEQIAATYPELLLLAERPK